jgi:hypothetical protein
MIWERKFLEDHTIATKESMHYHNFNEFSNYYSNRIFSQYFPPIKYTWQLFIWTQRSICAITIVSPRNFTMSRLAKTVLIFYLKLRIFLYWNIKKFLLKLLKISFFKLSKLPFPKCQKRILGIWILAILVSTVANF